MFTALAEPAIATPERSSPKPRPKPEARVAAAPPNQPRTVVLLAGKAGCGTTPVETTACAGGGQ